MTAQEKIDEIELLIAQFDNEEIDTNEDLVDEIREILES